MHSREPSARVVAMSGEPAILVAYATKHGSTREVADAIGAALLEHGLLVDVLSAQDVHSLEPYAGVVLGGALYMGRWHRDAREFLKRHEKALESIPLAVFGMGPKTLDDADVAGARAQLDAALAKTPTLTPDDIAVFGGVIDPAKLRFPLSRLPASDARDWDAIHEFTERAASLMHNAEVARV